MFKEMTTLTLDQQYDLLRKEATGNAYFENIDQDFTTGNAYFEYLDRDWQALEEQLMAKKLEQWVANK
jgi:hypothetical protein